MCEYLNNPKLDYPYTRSKLNRPRLKSSCPSRFDPKCDPKSLTLSQVLDAILTLELLNQHVIASKLDFESIVEAKHQ